MIVPSWLKIISFCHVAVLAASCAPQQGATSSTAAVVPLDATRTTSTGEASGREDLLPAGEYITAQGWGHLVIFRRLGEPAAFSIQSLTGENACDITGELANGRGIAVEPSSETSCVLDLAGSAAGIAVSTKTPEECKHFCGWNGGFEGVYLKAEEECRPNQIESTRGAFKQLYDRKDYEAALSKLSPVLDNCSSLLDWEAEGAIRNDIAITQHQAGLESSCLDTLKPYAEDARKDDVDVMAGWPPVVADRYLAIVTAARANIALCAGDLK